MKKRTNRILSVLAVSMTLITTVSTGLSIGALEINAAVTGNAARASAISMSYPASEMTEIGPGMTPWLTKEITDSADELEKASNYITIKPEKFRLPEEAKLLVAVEGTGGSKCTVYVWEKPEDTWKLRLITLGCLGENGMSNHRVSGDRTTPIGVFQLNTPFGQADPLDGFPADYVKVTETYVWEDETNRLTISSEKSGERVGTAAYARIYDYVLDAGYNKNAIEKKGSALFLHCTDEGKKSSAGCVAIPEESMIMVMRLFGTYGEGACYIAQAPRGTFDLIYDTYGTNNGLSPEGDFGR